MDCERAKTLLMGLIDNELSEADRAVVHEHLAACGGCRHEEAEFRRLADVTSRLTFREPTHAEWRQWCRETRNRLERGIGFGLLSFGMLTLGLYGLWELLSGFLMDSERSPALRVGVGAASAGALVVAASVVRERIRLYRTDRYEEVEL